MVTTPKPGSDDALAQGCKCPVGDNKGGCGSYWGSEAFVVRMDCPLHGKEWPESWIWAVDCPECGYPMKIRGGHGECLCGACLVHHTQPGLTLVHQRMWYWLESARRWTRVKSSVMRGELIEE